ncbi:MAG: aminotransferase class V-fold PLP-dependent enzyme [Bacteroidota bacterium]
MAPFSRRQFLTTALAAGGSNVLLAGNMLPPDAVNDFLIRPDITYLNNASTHPMPKVSVEAMQEFIRRKASGETTVGELFATMKQPRILFSQLINADLGEIALVNSTMAGENAVVAGLGLHRAKGNIVTDALHWEGSMYMYKALESKDLALRIARTRDYGIDLNELDKLIDGDTRLVAVSLVASRNGFRHDLAAVCRLAHAKGALVYADIIQAVGAFPVDVKATGVDFCACGSYKWMMGDCGTGFVYVRKDLLGNVFKKEQWGYLQCEDLTIDEFQQSVSKPIVQFTERKDARGYIETATPSFCGLVGAAKSLELVLKLGPGKIGAHIKPLIDHLKEELPKRGYPLMTPRGNQSPTALFSVSDGKALAKRLEERKIRTTIHDTSMRVSPGIFSTPQDIDKLMEALPRL